MGLDPCSFTNSDVFKTTDVNFIWKIDFDLAILDGSVELKCSVEKPTSTFILDTRFLNIKSVNVDGKTAKFELGEFHPAKGRALTVTASQTVQPGTTIIHICYTTTDKCPALQWLTPAQTCGGKYPYLD